MLFFRIAWITSCKKLGVIDIHRLWFSVAEAKPVYKKSALKVIGMCKFMPRTLKSKQTEKMQGRKNNHI